MTLRTVRGAFVLTLALAIGLLPLTLCLDPSMSSDAEMACCVKGHECPPATAAHECCKSPRILEQQLVPGKADSGAVIPPAVLTYWLAADPVPDDRVPRVEPAPRARSAPLYLVDSTLRI